MQAVLARYLVGAARRRESEAAERRDQLLRLQAVVRRQRLEAGAVGLVQKVYRGHICRKAVRRWALKKVRQYDADTRLIAAPHLCLLPCTAYSRRSCRPSSPF